MVLNWSDFDAAFTATGTLHAVIPDEPDRSLCNVAVLVETSDQPWNPLHPDACSACARAPSTSSSTPSGRPSGATGTERPARALGAISVEQPS
jgi:hypothetical protein